MNKKLETLKELFGILNVNAIYYAVTGMGWFAKDYDYGITTPPDKITVLVMPSEFFQAIALIEGRKPDDPFVRLIKSDVDSWIAVTRSKTINFDGIEVEVIQEVNRFGLFFHHEEMPGFFTTVDNPADGGKYLKPLDHLLWMADGNLTVMRASTMVTFMPTLLKQIEQDPIQDATFKWIRQGYLTQFWAINHAMNAYDTHRYNVGRTDLD